MWVILIVIDSKMELHWLHCGYA